jgi:hypothetical protein
MKTKTFLLALIIFSSSFIALSQVQEKSTPVPFYRNQIGIQLNPYLNSNETFDALVYGIRYGYRITKPLTIGVEFSGSYPAFNYYLKHFDNKIGVFARYIFMPEKRFNGFIEVSPFFSHRNFLAVESYPAAIENKFGLYGAPGISLYSKNRKYSFDLYYKFYFYPSNSFAHYGNTISYKVNFYF